MAEPQNTYTAFILPSYSLRERRAIGNAIVNYIRQRTSDKKGVGRTRLKNYEENYANHVDFKAAGKRRTNPNMKLTGEMMSDLRVLDISLPGRVVIGFKANSKSNDKSVWNREWGYDWLGLSNAELSSIMANFPPPATQQEIIQQLVAQRQIEQIEEEENGDNP